MKDITISRTAQLVGLATLLSAVTAAVVAQLPELRRYLRVRSM